MGKRRKRRGDRWPARRGPIPRRVLRGGKGGARVEVPRWQVKR